MRDFLGLFLPSSSNNYRSSLLHHRVLILLTIFFFTSGLLIHSLKNNFPSVLGVSSNITYDQLLSLTNQQREQNGASDLTLNDDLSKAAANKASDMFAKNYWAHNAPDGTTPWVFIKGAGYEYTYAGENLARGFTTSDSVVTAWMNSPEHRQNMLSTNYRNVGFAVATGTLNGEETVLVVEMLGSTNFAPAPVAKTKEPAQVALGPTSAPSQAAEILSLPTITLSPTLAAQTNTPTPTPLTVAKSSTLATNISSFNPTKTLINSATFSSISARTILLLFIFVLILDMVIIERKKIVRFVGHNLDHVLFFTIIIVVLTILAKGVIL